jgi:hypothetical protein
MKMKALGTAVAFFGALTLMLAILIAQRDYQRSWDAGAVAQTSTVSVDTPASPERIAQVNR